MNKKGFTLIETLVAMTILATILLSGAQLLSTFFTAHVTSRDTISATYLAQECLEISRNNRDSNWLQNKPWNQNLEKGISLKYKIFTRNVLFKNISFESVEEKDFPIEIQITCKISWKNITGNHSLSINQILTNWRKK